MPDLENSIAVAATDRPLPLRRRPDLVVSARWQGGARWHVVKDPLALAYYYLTEEEHFVLTALDGAASLADLEAQFEARFAPRRLPPDRLLAFLAQLHCHSLVLSDAAGQGEEIHARRQRRQRLGPLQLLERLLVVRLRGACPRVFLGWLGPKLGWIFAWPAVAVWLLVVSTAIAVTLAHWDEFYRRLPTARAFLTADNLLWLGAALIVVKTLHELGHALAAWRFGCQPHEMGVQFFFLLPCLYTNVTDAWLLPSKWQRMAVSAAGMYVELFVAAVAALLWWSVEPGASSAVCQSVMLVASLGTLVLNGNPLLRYDGYYLLSDLIDTPNLEARSRLHLASLLADWSLGVAWQSADSLDQRRQPWLAAYAAAAFAYRVVVLAGVYLLVRGGLARWRLEPAGDVLLAAAVAGLIIPYASALGNFVMQAQRQGQIRWTRLAATLVVIGGLVAGATFVPLPQRVVAPAVIEADDAAEVYVTVAGRLVEAVPEGALVRQGEILARLENAELKGDLARLESERKALSLHLAALETMAASRPETAAGIPAARQSLADLDQRIEQVEALAAKLTLVAPQDGIVLPPPTMRRPPGVRLAAWSGTPLDRENVGSFLETGTLLCEVAPAGRARASIVLQQADVALITPGAPVRLVLPQASGGTVAATIDEISRLEADKLPPHLVAADLVPHRDDPRGEKRPPKTVYQARARLMGDAGDLVPGQIGRASITARAQPIAPRIWRWLAQTFRLAS